MKQLSIQMTNDEIGKVHTQMVKDYIKVVLSETIEKEKERRKQDFNQSLVDTQNMIIEDVIIQLFREVGK